MNYLMGYMVGVLSVVIYMGVGGFNTFFITLSKIHCCGEMKLAFRCTLKR